jgi:hypothetical protein
MAAITLRLTKGSPLTNAEIDANFTNINNEVATKLTTTSYTAADVLSKLLTVDTDAAGINATTLISLAPATGNANAAAAIVAKDASGNFSASTITATSFSGPLTGNVTGNLTGNISGTAAGLSATLSIGSGGTGETTRQAALDALAGSTTSGQYLRGNGADVVMSAIVAGDVPTLNQNTTGTSAGLTITRETVFAITDGAAFEINPANGGIQTITLGANRTPKGTSFTAGQSVTLMITAGAFLITWTDTTFGPLGIKWVGVSSPGGFPTLSTSAISIVELWKVGSQVYGAFVGIA